MSHLLEYHGLLSLAEDSCIMLQAEMGIGRLQAVEHAIEWNNQRLVHVLSSSTNVGFYLGIVHFTQRVECCEIPIGLY